MKKRLRYNNKSSSRIPAVADASRRHLTARSGLEVMLYQLLQSTLVQKERRNDLPELTPQRARELYEAYRRGEMADVQLMWDQLEERDETLFTVLHARLGALAEMPWAVNIDADLAVDMQPLAERQKLLANELLAAVENLPEALTHLGMADFRGVAALEVTGNAQRMRWEVIEPWNLCRPVRRGPWYYNAEATSTPTRPEELDPTAVIIREAQPIDLPAMFLICAKYLSVHAWDAFLEVFGIPNIFLEMPPATPEEKAMEFDAVVQRLIGEGRGTVPSGAKFHTVETSKDNTQSFEARAKWCNEAIIQLATGGLLTVTTQSGSGTLAGNAHSDSFSRLCAASARSISTAINRQFLRPALQAAFPHEPILVSFELAPEPVDDRKQLAELLAALNAAGWAPSAETVSEMMNFEVQRVQQPPTGTNTQAQPVMNRADAPGYESPSGRFLRRGDSASEEEDSVESPAESEPPLNEGELEALRFLGAGLNPEQVAEDAAFMAEAMRESTIDPSSPIGYAEAGDLRMENSAAAPQEEEDVVTNAAVRVFKRDNQGRFAVTGAVLKKNKGGRGSRGKKMLGKTGSPNLVEAGDSKRKTKRALVKAFDEAKEGKKVSTGYKMGSHEVTLAPGDKEHWGTHHAERKEHPKKISSDKLAEMTMHGKRRNERGNTVTIKEGDDLLVFAPENQPTAEPGEKLKRKQQGKRVVGKNWYKQ